MLSKSQARFFFLAATLGFSAVFLWLTVVTISQVPERSHEDKLDAAVVRGKTLWDQNNCMGCHTILGEGADYAPELTKVVERRGAAWIDRFLQDPEAMYPGRRKMVKYNFTPEERQDVIAFFNWVGNIDTNGFPAKPDMAPAPVVQATTAPLSPPPTTFSTVCVRCHAVGGKKGAVGPALDGVATRFDAAKLDTWLRDPAAVKPGTAMPNLGLDDATRAELVTWLMTLR
jgi:nitric oxide reductase subunit C